MMLGSICQWLLTLDDEGHKLFKFFLTMHGLAHRQSLLAQLSSMDLAPVSLLLLLQCKRG